MGCISSKIMSRSRSFQEELSLSFQRRTDDMPGLDDLLAAKNGGDQFLALLCTANTVAMRLKVGTPTQQESNKSANPTGGLRHLELIAKNASDEPASPETINTWELMADLEEKEEEGSRRRHVREQSEVQLLMMHSESFRKTEYEVTMTEENSSVPFEKSDPVNPIGSAGDGGESIVPRSKSFRTVEDYDAMIAGNPSIEGREEDMLTLRRNINIWLESGMNVSEHVEEGDDIIINSEQDDEQPSVSGVADDEEDSADRRGNDEEVVALMSGTHGGHLNSEVNDASAGTSEVTGAKLNICRKRNSSTAGEKGLRRKAMAKDLATLKVPSFEFSSCSIGSLGEWLDVGGQVYTPGSYVTPKFGSVNLPPSKGGRDDSSGRDDDDEDTVFDPELVADLEEAMERLTMEEEHILEQILRSLRGGTQEEEDVGDDKGVQGHT